VLVPVRVRGARDGRRASSFPAWFVELPVKWTGLVAPTFRQCASPCVAPDLVFRAADQCSAGSRPRRAAQTSVSAVGLPGMWSRCPMAPTGLFAWLLSWCLFLVCGWVLLTKSLFCEKNPIAVVENRPMDALTPTAIIGLSDGTAPALRQAPGLSSNRTASHVREPGGRLLS
jgi:hypothetical protein